MTTTYQVVPFRRAFCVADASGLVLYKGSKVKCEAQVKVWRERDERNARDDAECKAMSRVRQRRQAWHDTVQPVRRA